MAENSSSLSTSESSCQQFANTYKHQKIKEEATNEWIRNKWHDHQSSGNSWRFFSLDDNFDPKEYKIYRVFVSAADSKYSEELQRTLYPIFKYGILYLRRKEATKQIIDFYEDNISLFNTSQDKNELDIIQTIVYRYTSLVHYFYMNQWLSQHPILFLSDDTVSLIHRFCRGEGLYTIQDMLSRRFIIKVPKKSPTSQIASSLVEPVEPIEDMLWLSSTFTVGSINNNPVIHLHYHPSSDTILQSIYSLTDSIKVKPLLGYLRLNHFVESQSPLFSLGNHEKHIICSTISPSFFIIAVATDDSRIHIFSRSGYREPFIHNFLIGHYHSVTQLCISKDDKYLISCSIDGDVRLWCLSTMKCLCCYSFVKAPLWCIAFNQKNNAFVCGGLNGLGYICSTSNTVKPDIIFSTHQSDIIRCSFSRNDLYVFTADQQGVIRMTNSISGKCQRLFITHSNIICFALGKEDTILTVGDEDGYLHVYSVETSELLIKKHFFDCHVSGICMIGDLKIILTSENGFIKVVRLFFAKKDGKTICNLEEVDSYYVNGNIHDLIQCDNSIFAAVEYES